MLQIYNNINNTNTFFVTFYVTFYVTIEKNVTSLFYRMLHF